MCFNCSVDDVQISQELSLSCVSRGKCKSSRSEIFILHATFPPAFSLQPSVPRKLGRSHETYNVFLPRKANESPRDWGTILHGTLEDAKNTSRRGCGRRSEQVGSWNKIHFTRARCVIIEDVRRQLSNAQHYSKVVNGVDSAC